MNELLETILSPIGSLAGGAQAAFDRARARVKQDEEAAVRQRLIELEQQRQLVESQTQDPLRQIRFGVPEQIELAQLYGKADIDPVAMQKAELFRENIEQIKNPAALINIAQGKEYKPVSQSGGIFWNPYDTKNPLLKTTDKYQADTETAKIGTEKARAEKREAVADANLAEKRTQLFNLNIAKITDPLLQLDAAQNKSVFKAEEAEIEGKDGSVHQGMAVLTPNGTYSASSIIDAATKAPLKIPKESSKGGTKESPEMLKARELVKAGVEPDLQSALQRIYSSRQDTPEQAWSTIVRSNTKNAMTGKPYKLEQILTNAIQQWTLENRGQPFPENIVETIGLMDIDDKEKQRILATVANYNKTFQTQPQPAAQPLTPIAIHGAWTAIQQGESPEAVQQALQRNGFDTSAESVNLMAIDAINQGAPAEEIQKYLSLIGLDWTPPQASP